MSLEVELKYAVTDVPELELRVISAGYQFVSKSSQTDRYFQHPARDFAVTDEAFRIRFDEQQGYLTYKGPLLDTIAKTRKEIEIALHPVESDPLRISEMLISLGFRMVLDVCKTRTLYQRQIINREIHLCLDQVAGLGSFVEIETIVAEEEKDAARDILLRLADELNLSQIERRSYLRLLLAKQVDNFQVGKLSDGHA